MIPRILHHIWIGSQLPSHFLLACRERAVELHPHWDIYFWTNEALYEDLYFRNIQLLLPTSLLKNRYNLRADILRYAVLAKYGGVYLDMDIYCIKALDYLLEHEFIYGEHGTYTNPEPDPGTGRPANGVLGVAPGSDIMHSLLKEFSDFHKTGIHTFGDALKKIYPTPPPLSRKIFYPHYWTQNNYRYRVYPETATIHCWNKLEYDLTTLSKLHPPSEKNHNKSSHDEIKR